MKANRFAKNDEGVSAVIGVILMVAITVILAAVIAAFVFGMVGNVKKTYNVAVTASRDGNTVTVTYNGGPDSGQVSTLTVGGMSSDGTTAISKASGKVTSATDTFGSVGSLVTVSDGVSNTGQKTHIIVTGKFTDNTQSVVLDEYV